MKSLPTESPLSAPLLERSETQPAPFRVTRLVCHLSVAAASSLHFGFGTGSLNNLDVLIPSSLAAAGSPVSLVQWAWVVSSFAIGGFIGSALSHKVLGEYFGRKHVLLLTNLLVAVSSVLLMTATSWYELLAGRLCSGIVAGIVAGVVPMYLAEISPSRWRDTVGLAHLLGITLGYVAAQVLTAPSLRLMGTVQRWRLLFAVPLACSLLQTGLLPLFPESPVYLYKTQGSSAALTQLAQLHAAPSISSHMSSMRSEAASYVHNEKDCTLGDLLSERALRRKLAVSIGVQLSMQLSGIDVVLTYSSMIFRLARVQDPQLATVALAFANLLASLAAACAVGPVGQRRLLLLGWLGLFSSYLLAATSMIGAELRGVDGPAAPILVLAAMLGVVVSFAAGPGCVGWLVVSELFPARARGAATALGVTVNWVANGIMTFMFPLALRAFGPYTLIVFVALSACCGWFIYCCVPETMIRTDQSDPQHLDLSSTPERRADTTLPRKGPSPSANPHAKDAT